MKLHIQYMTLKPGLGPGLENTEVKDKLTNGGSPSGCPNFFSKGVEPKVSLACSEVQPAAAGRLCNWLRLQYDLTVFLDTPRIEAICEQLMPLSRISAILAFSAAVGD